MLSLTIVGVTLYIGVLAVRNGEGSDCDGAVREALDFQQLKAEQEAFQEQYMQYIATTHDVEYEDVVKGTHFESATLVASDCWTVSDSTRDWIEAQERAIR